MMELFQQYNVEFVSSTEKFDTSTPMGRAMLNICIVFAQLEREKKQKGGGGGFSPRRRQMGGEEEPPPPPHPDQTKEHETKTKKEIARGKARRNRPDV